MAHTYEFRPDGEFLTYVCVRISETRKKMNADSKSFFKKHNKPIEFNGDTAGMSTPTAIRSFPGYEKATWYCDRFVTVFLNHEDLRKYSHEIIPHEALHAAMTHERAVIHFDMRYSPDGDTIEDEERLAYKVGQIAKGLSNTVRIDMRKNRSMGQRRKKK